MTYLPFSKLKPGMLVFLLGEDATLVSKHAGTKTAKLLFPSGEERTVEAVSLWVKGRHPLDQINPMLAKDIAKQKTHSMDNVLSNPFWAMEEKYDGERQILTYIPFSLPVGVVDEFLRTHEDVLFRATTRVVGKNSGRLAVNTRSVQHLSHAPVCYGGATVFDVELLHEDGFQRLRSIMGSLPERALALQEEHGYVSAVVFDVLWYAGIDMRERPFAERRQTLETHFRTTDMEQAGLHLSPIARTQVEKKAMMERVLSAGGEGVMAKSSAGVYTDTSLPGQRSADLLKVKPFQEDDVIIYGFEAGKGEYNQHKFGAIKFAQIVNEEDLTADMSKNCIHGEEASSVFNKLLDVGLDLSVVHMGSCSGITDEQEAAFRADPESYIGRVMEVRFQQRWPDTGLMRHPNFVRLRDDKTAAECIYGRDA
jgi:ATP-dependent DNA ligase